MTRLTTQDITVTVESLFQPQYSEPDQDKYVFAYRIQITNEGAESVQLLSRYWRIVEGDGTTREVEGEGVIGKQPIIDPGRTHRYVSWVQLGTPLGAMDGFYEFRRQWEENPVDEERFQATVPRFLHWAPELNN
ncbi:MAG: Co2+/Mg2+ efflux protein ApaG [Bacteroidota bacterium]